MDERIKSIRMEEERSHKELYEKETLISPTPPQKGHPVLGCPFCVVVDEI